MNLLMDEDNHIHLLICKQDENLVPNPKLYSRFQFINRIEFSG